MNKCKHRHIFEQCEMCYHPQLTIRQMSWFKRRIPTITSMPIVVEIPNLRLVEEHKCEMFVKYDNGEILVLSGRVNQNPITKKWAIHGIDNQGHQCMVDVS